MAATQSISNMKTCISFYKNVLERWFWCLLSFKYAWYIGDI